MGLFDAGTQIERSYEYKSVQLFQVATLTAIGLCLLPL